MSIFIKNLLKRQLITTSQAEAIKGHLAKAEKSLCELLVDFRFLKAPQLVEFMSEAFGISHTGLEENTIDLTAMQHVPYETALKYGVFPLKIEEGALCLAMSDPTNIMTRDDIRAITKMNLRPFYCEKSRILTSIQKYYRLEGVFGDMLDEKVSVDRFEIQDSHSHKEVYLEQLQSDDKAFAPVVRLVNQILRDSVQCRASDVHLEPHDSAVQVRYRIDGDLRNIAKIPRKLQGPLIARIKVMCDLDIAEKRRPQDGGIKINMGDRRVDLRVSVIPTFFGEKVVIRILDPKTTKTQIDSLGFEGKDLDLIKDIVQKPQGMVLVTGPTGSGKTSTIYAALNYTKSEAKNIITIEDPIEYLISGINQIQVNVKAGITFARGLRSILRQDPNVILVGEIRDEETADIALRASMTGHLVFSTLHTNGAIATLGRLFDIGLKPYLVASCLSAIIAQRLVRINCANCRTPYLPSAKLIEKFRPYLENSKVNLFYKGQGCDHCLGTGYLGRTAVYELFFITDKIRELIIQRASELDILRELQKNGFRTLAQCGVDKVAEGTTTLEEVLNVVDVVEDFSEALSAIKNAPPIELFAKKQTKEEPLVISERESLDSLVWEEFKRDRI